MQIKSPIRQLVETLEQVKHSAKQHEGKLRKNEATTRAALIDPVIRALGWDTANPEMVEFERYYRDTKLDYALSDRSGEVRIIVEAKALMENLNDDKIFTKILSYGITYKIPNVFLTDGIIWKHYKLAEFNKLEPVVLDLNKDSLVACAKYLIDTLDAAQYWEEDGAQPSERIVESIPKRIDPSVPVFASLLPETHVSSALTPETFISLTDLEENLAGKKPPVWFRLPDGTKKPVKSWRDILLESVNFVLNFQPSLPIPLPDKAGKKCKLIDFQKMTQKGMIVKGKYQGREVFIYLNYDSNHIISNAVYVLNFLPVEVCKVTAAVSY